MKFRHLERLIDNEESDENENNTVPVQSDFKARSKPTTFGPENIMVDYVPEGAVMLSDNKIQE